MNEPTHFGLNADQWRNVGVGATAVGGAFSIYGNIEAGRAAVAQGRNRGRAIVWNAENEARYAREEAERSRVMARNTLVRTSEKLALEGRQTQANIAKIQNTFASSGLRMDSDTATALALQQEIEQEQLRKYYTGRAADEAVERLNAASTLETRAENALIIGRYEAQLARAAGEDAKRQANMNAIGSALSTIGGVATIALR